MRLGNGRIRALILLDENKTPIIPADGRDIPLLVEEGIRTTQASVALTGGDPGKQSQLLALNIYDTFYARSGPQWKGIGQAKAVVFFVLVVVIALIQLRATSSKEVQQ